MKNFLNKTKNVFTKKSSTVEEPEKREKNQEDKGEEGEVEVTEEAMELQEKPVSPDEVMIMKKGDYAVHVLIEEIKNWIILKKDSDLLPYPTIKITCLGKSERTAKTKLPVAKYHQFGEHFYFKKSDLTEEMLDSEKIVIEAYDSRNTKRKDYYGIFEFDFEFVYNRKDHALKNYWLALANPESDNISEVRGYLKLSISVLHNTDPRVELEMSDSTEDCLVPTQVKTSYKQISLYFFRGEELPNLDETAGTFFGFDNNKDRKCDGYVEVNYMGMVRKTKWSKMRKNVCVWNQVIDIPVAIPVVSKKIILNIKDYDGKLMDDDVAGSIELSLDDIIPDPLTKKENKYAKLTYLPIYGAPDNNVKEKYHKMMNTNAEVASSWNGRILMKIDVADVEAPVSNIRNITDETLMREAKEIEKPFIWKVYAKLYDALFLPDSKEKYSVIVAIEQEQKEVANFDTKEKTTSATNLNKNVEFTVNSVSKEVTVFPDIFIYLRSGKKNICFQRFSPETIHLNQDVILVKLIQDPCFKKVKSPMISGLLRMKLCLHNPELDPAIDIGDMANTLALSSLPSTFDLSDPSEQGGSDDGFPANYTVVAVVYMSRQLIAAEKDGTSDPYVKLTCPNYTGPDQVQQTRKIMSTTNGIWNEARTFENVNFVFNIKATWPIFLLQVYDWNRTGDVPLGYSYVWLNEAAYRYNDPGSFQPKWHQLYLPQSNKKQGQVLMSFYIFSENKKDLINQIQYKPETIPYSCEINILGLRQLKPLSLMPVKKPYIKINTNSLNVTGEEKNALQNISTIPSDTGANPTINTIIKFDCQLPKDMALMPELQCEVYDHLLNGLSNSLLGIFNINLEEAIKYTNQFIDEDLKITSKKFGIFAMKGGLNKFLAAQKEKENEENEEVKEEIKTTDNLPKEEDDKKEMLIPKEEKKEEEEDKINIPLNNENNENNDQIDTTEKDENGNDINKVNVVKSIDIPNEDLIQMPYDSRLFMLLPRITKFEIPGYKTDSEGNDKGEKIQKDFLIEDKTNLPPKDMYFPVGYIIKVDNNYGGWDPKKDRKEITKHYRRRFNMPLENINNPDFIKGSPFDRFPLRRGKYDDKASDTQIFTEMSDINNKILGKNGPGATEEKRKQKEEEEKKELEEEIASSVKTQSTGFFTGEESKKSYGFFKAIFSLAEKEKYEKYKNTIKKYQEDQEKTGLSIGKDFANATRYISLSKEILAKKSVIIRIYVLELNNLAKRDLLSESDPYIKIYLNDKEKVNEKKNYQEDQKDCKWYKYYDIVTDMPGGSNLRLEVWDYDDLFSDDLIGQTVIDIEDRYFDSTWRALENKPIELRPLAHPDYSDPQGEALIWIEMFDTIKRDEELPWNITPEPNQDFELRFIVWECENMDLMDVEGTSDLYVLGYVEMNEKQSTDVHYRSQDGNGSFNWRILLPMHTPHGKHHLNIQVYDKDLFAHDDFICDSRMDLSKLLEISKLTGLPIKLDRDFYNNLKKEDKDTFGVIEFLSKEDDPEGIKFWYCCYDKNNECKNRRVLISIEILPKALAELSKVGKGRDEPNVNPYLPPPTGRFECSLNPMKLLRQCVGKKFRRKVCCYCIIIILAVAVIILVPYWLFSSGFGLLK